MSLSFYKQFQVPTPDGGIKVLRLNMPGLLGSIAAGLVGFAWLLSVSEWAAAFGGLALGIALNVGLMGIVVSPNKRLFTLIDLAKAAGNDRVMARTIWFESYFLHAFKALTIFLSFASPILLLRGGGSGAHLLPAVLFGLCLADPPQAFLTDESGDKDWHATFIPFCQVIPIVLAVAEVAWRMPFWSLVGPYAILVFVSAVVMAKFNLKRYRSKPLENSKTAKFDTSEKETQPSPKSSPNSASLSDDLSSSALIPGSHIGVSLMEVPRKKKRLPPGAFRVGGEVHSTSSSQGSRRHANRRPKGRH